MSDIGQTVYIRCCYCGTMKPNNADPDDQIAELHQRFSNQEIPEQEQDEETGRYLSIIERWDIFYLIFSFYRDGYFEYRDTIRALKAAKDEVVHESVH